MISSVILIVHLGGPQLAFFGEKGIAMEPKWLIEPVPVLGTVEVPLEHSVRDPALPIKIGMVGGKTTAFGEGLVGLQIFLSCPECGVYLLFGVTEEVMG